MATRSTRPTGTESSEKGTGRTRAAMPDPTEAMASMHRTFVEPLKGMAEDMAERIAAADDVAAAADRIARVLAVR